MRRRGRGAISLRLLALGVILRSFLKHVKIIEDSVKGASGQGGFAARPARRSRLSSEETRGVMRQPGVVEASRERRLLRRIGDA